MASLDDLPVELRLQILAYLPLQSLLWIRLTCRRWNDFFVANASAIYRNAAGTEGFVEFLEMPLAQAVADAQYVNIVQNDTEPPDWYTFCRVSAIYRNVSKLAPLIRRILMDPTTDLNVVSVKLVREAILERDANLTAEFMEMKKSQVGQVISKVYQDFTSTANLRPSAC
ncbi:hypothetical protein PYCCODRAFT_1469960 [Trametes coccinea BRFM310]|uniref:F-box domain-containing protein n=1 Tax=Trametes coccinea (strain BRFM310) TaxID=1353009 RepID=A0A1Y2IIU7_TRAC3|nr:hypothetical protein PYCCODRAFT_1469960 [Trametes coccinea BRFM310]